MNLPLIRLSENPIFIRLLNFIPLSWRKYYFERKINKAVPVVVYTMGKVASKSIHYSLLQQYDGVVLFSHSIYKDHEDWQIQYIYEWVTHDNGPIKIISLTREPISRNISAFFQNFERETGFKYEKAKFSIDELFQMFLDDFPHDTPLKWFQLRLHNIFGVDVYAVPFPESGASTYVQDNIEVLVMRAELDDPEKEKLIRQFLEMDDFQLKNQNIGNQKNYASMYKQFKNEIKLPPEYVNRMCDSKYFNHFYPPEVIEDVRKKWLMYLSIVLCVRMVEPIYTLQMFLCSLWSG